VEFDEALERVRAALRARDEISAQEGREILVIARTDVVRCITGDAALQEGVRRCQAFEAAGADIVYAEGLADAPAMRAVTGSIRTPTMLAQVESGGAALLSETAAAALGFRLLLRGVTLLNAYIAATRRALAALRRGPGPAGGDGAAWPPDLLPFDEVCAAVGFPAAVRWEADVAAAAAAAGNRSGGE
jgi:2-methylisocitrate lyase-like PEP mutase family enzyme